MQVKKVGRPKKEFAKKAGELSLGQVYFTFIADEKTVKNLKKIAKDKGISIKQLMANVLKKFKPKEVKLNHEQKLMHYFENKKLSNK